jgi:hypothetical protein
MTGSSSATIVHLMVLLTISRPPIWAPNVCAWQLESAYLTIQMEVRIKDHFKGRRRGGRGPELGREVAASSNRASCQRLCPATDIAAVSGHGGRPR